MAQVAWTEAMHERIFVLWNEGQTRVTITAALRREFDAAVTPDKVSHRIELLRDRGWMLESRKSRREDDHPFRRARSGPLVEVIWPKNDKGCMWPLWNPHDDTEIRFCGRRRDPNCKSIVTERYCKRHGKMAVAKPNGNGSGV